MNEKIDNINSKVELHHTEEPNKLMSNIKQTIVNIIVGAIVGAIIALVIK
jgi:tetrahydromethanopterin S-methyltransferase subunit G